MAEELHFGRAADRLHIEQSPLSRTIKELEERLGIRLFNRDRRGTHLTRAGKVFLQEVRRVFVTLEQAKDGARAAAAGHSGQLRVALSDGTTQPRLAALLALCREEEPSVEIRIAEVPLMVQLRGLRDGTYDAGLARTNEVGEGIAAYPLWRESLVVAIPSRHPLLAHQLIPLAELMRYPLIMCHPEIGEGYCRQMDRIFRAAEVEPNVAERATSLEMMLTLVAAGYGVGFAAAEKIAMCRHPEVVVRPLAHDDTEVTTYLLTKNDSEGCERLNAFVGRAMREAQVLNRAT